MEGDGKVSRRYGLVIDLERCTGCHTCTVACKLENGIEEGSWITVRTVGGARMDTAAGRYPELRMGYEPRLCMHCAEPPCIDACPLEAITRRDDGIVLIDAARCDGCRMCLAACPYGAITFDERAGVAGKCHLCAHRIDQGLEPFCVICCQTEAIYFGDLADPQSEVSRLVASGRAFVLLPEEKTGPAVYYLPPLERRGLP